MTYLLLGDIDAGTSEETIQEFLTRYGFPRFDALQYVPGNGRHPAVLLSFERQSSQALRKLVPRIHQLFWNSRMISAIVLNERF